MKILNIKQLISVQLSYVLVALPVYSANLQTNGSTNTSLDKARNNVPIINIANPNQSGLSHNKFTHYNVAKEGLILNNSKETFINTKLSGYIFGNKNLATNAKVILNEITSTNRTNLNGYTEIAGKKADLIIANPNGISINGAGFINTSNLTLSTAKPILSNGNINYFNVIQNSDISVEGNGLDTSRQDSTDIYTHYLQLNGKIIANNLGIKLGINNIDYKTKNVVSSQNSNSSNLLLDSSLLGGMYTNRISLVGTDKGLGVNLPPEVLASSEGIEVLNTGEIITGKLSSAKDIDIESLGGDINIKDTVYTKGLLDIKSDKTIKIDNIGVFSKKNIILSSNVIENNGTFIAGLDEDGSLNTTGEFLIDTKSLINNNTLQSTKELKITSENISNNKNIKAIETLNIDSNLLSNNLNILSNGDINLKSNELINNSVIHSNKNIFINGGDIQNSKTIIANKNLVIDVEDINTYGGQIAATNIDIDSQNIKNIATNILSLDTFSIKNGEKITNDGIFQSNKFLHLESKEFENKDTIFSKEQLNIKSSSFNNNGRIQSNKDSKIESNILQNTTDIISLNTLHLATQDMVNNGNILAITKMDIDSKKLVSNSGIIQANHILNISTKDLTNKNTIVSNEIALNSENITNKKDILSSNNIIVNQNEALLNEGVIQADARIILNDTNEFENKNIMNAKTIDIKSNRVKNSGIIQAKNNLDIKANNLANSKTIISNDTLKFKTDSFTTLSGDIISNNISIDTNSFDSIDANLLALTELIIDSKEYINNSGKIQSNNTLNLISNKLENKDTLLSNEMEFSIKDILNNGQILSNNNLLINENNSILNTKLIQVNNLLDIKDINSFENQATIDTKTLDVKSDSFINNGIIQTDNTSISNTKDLKNLGTIHSNIDLKIDSQTIENSKNLSAVANLNIDTNSFSSTSGKVVAKDIELQAKDKIDIKQSELLAINNLDISSKIIENSSLVQSNNTLNLTVDEVKNDNTLLAKDITLNTQNIENNANIIANNKLVINKNRNLQNNGILKADTLLEIKDTDNLVNNAYILTKDANIKTTTLTNTNEIKSVGALTLDSQFMENTKNILSNGKLILDVKTLLNKNTIHSNNNFDITLETLQQNNLLSSAKALNLNTNGGLQIDDGEIFAKDLTINSKTLDIGQSEFLAFNNINLNIQDKLNNNGIIKANGTLNIFSNSLENKNTIEANTIDIFTTQDLINKGIIYGDTSLKLRSENLENKNTISSDRDLILEITNNINNSNSKILSLGDIKLSSNYLDNTSGEILSDKNIQLIIQEELINKNAQIKSNQNTNIKTKFFNNKNAIVETYGDLSIDINSIDLTNSQLRSNNNLTLKLDALDNLASSSLKAKNILHIQADNYITNNSDIVADGGIILDTNGKFTNNKTIASQGALNLSANSLVNSSTISSGVGQSYIDITSNIQNNSRISSQGDINILANNIVNDGFFNSAGVLNMGANNLTNNKTLFSSNDMNLYINNTLKNNENANIFAINNLKFANSSNGKTGLIINEKATISTYKGDININANSFKNITDTVQVERVKVGEDSIRIYVGRSGNKFFVIDYNHFYDSVRRVSYDPDPSLNDPVWISVRLLNHLNSAKSKVTNEMINEGDYYHKAIVRENILVDRNNQDGCNGAICVIHGVRYNNSELISAKTFDNQAMGGSTYYEVKYRDKSVNASSLTKYADPIHARVLEKLNEHYGKFGLEVGYEKFAIKTYTAEYYEDTFGLDGIFYLKINNPQKSERRDITVIQEEDKIVSSPSKHSILSSGGNMNLSVGNVENYLSSISASGNINFSSGDINNKGVALYEYITKISTYDNGTPLPKEYSSNLRGYYGSVIQAGGSIGGSINKLDNGDIKENQAISVSTRSGDVSTNGSGLSISRKNVGVNNTLADVNMKVQNITHNDISLNSIENKSVTLGTQDAQNTDIDLNNYNTKDTTINLSINEDKITNQNIKDTQLEDLSINIDIPQDNYGLFINSKNPDSNYLIETNPEFTIYENFVSSNYLLERIGFDPEEEIKKLGDGFYEQKLIRESIFTQTGKRYLDNNITNDNDQYQWLMQNAIQAQKDLDLAPGISLSIEQINSLNKDIVWMEEKIVNNEKVLVPVVYIADADNFKMEGSKILASKDINLEIETLNNIGKIEAGNDIAIKATDTINNIGGSILADNDIFLSADKGIRNISADILGDNITLDSKNGDILIQRYYESVDYSRLGAIDIQTLLARESNIVSQGELNINTLQNFLLQSSNLLAEDIDISAQSITLESLADEKIYHNGGDNANYFKTSSSLHLLSNLEADNINLNSTNTLDIIGTNLKANENINIFSDSVNIKAATDNTFSEYKETRKRGGLSGGSSVSIDTVSKTTQQSSTLEAKNINIASNKELNLIASKIKADETKITAQILNLISDKDIDYENHFRDSSGGITRTISKEGHHKESLVDASIQTNKLSFNDKDITNQLNNTLSKDNILKVISSQENLSIEQINQIETILTNKEWNEKTKTLTGVGSLIVQAIATYITAGAGSGLVAGISNTALNAAATSVISNITSQVLTSVVTGNSLSLDINSIAKGAITAGVLSYANSLAYTELNINTDITKMTTSDIIGKSVIDSTTQTAISGGSFKDNLLMNTVNNTQAKVSNIIGDSYLDGDINYVGHKFSHAITGAISAELRGEDGVSGALGAVTGEIIGEAVGSELTTNDFYTDKEKNTIRLISELGTIFTSEALDKDTSTALQSSKIAVENNVILHAPGTFSNKKDVDEGFIKATEEFYDDEMKIVDHDENRNLENNDKDRQLLADKIVKRIIEVKSANSNEPIYLTGHSHGGNVQKIVTQKLAEQGYSNIIDGIMYLGTPVRDDYVTNNSVLTEKASVFNVYDKDDLVQQNLGGNQFNFSYINKKLEEIGPAEQIVNDNPRVQNIQVESPKTGFNESFYYKYYGDHINIDSSEVIEQVQKRYYDK